MLTCEQMHDVFRENDITYFTGVPDSTFAPWMSYLAEHGDALEHRIAVNEGAAIAHAAGYHLATGGLGVVYLQNAGLGNCVNPLTSLVDPEIFGIPVLLMIGWRGEPGNPDEPQHRKMGRVTVPLLDTLDIHHRIVESEGIGDTVRQCSAKARRDGNAVALVVRKGLFAGYTADHPEGVTAVMSREEAVRVLANRLDPSDIVISTTGKTSRELFEYRVARGQRHDTDFYTVGSMGHANAIAMEVALQVPGRRVYVLDGDGALLMHMGSIATIGHYGPRNLVHVVFDNHCHESTGGQPTVSSTLDLVGLATACGYPRAKRCVSPDELRTVLDESDTGPSMVAVSVRTGSRADLGRPTVTTQELKATFTANLLAEASP